MDWGIPSLSKTNAQSLIWSFWNMLETALEVEITALLIQVSMMADGSLQRPLRHVMIWKEITNCFWFHSYQQLAGMLFRPRTFHHCSTTSKPINML